MKLMNPPKLGCLLLGKYHTRALHELAANVERWGYDVLWLADERFFRDVYASLALCAMATHRIQLGTCVTDPYSRHPALTAMAIATVDEISQQRALLGIGAGIAGFKEMGIQQRRPAQSIREAIQLIRQLLSGGRVTFHGETLTFEEGQLSVPARVDLPVYIAAKGPRNLQLAGEIANGVIVSSCVSDANIDHVLELVAHGAGHAERAVDTVELCTRINVAVSDDAVAAREAVKPMIAALLISKKPDFSFLDPVGLTMPIDLRERVEEAEYGHEPATLAAIAAKIPDEFVTRLAVAGTDHEVAQDIIRMTRRGVQQIIVYPIPSHGESEAAVLERVVSRVMPLVKRTLRD
jgi:5,10-methylenetetrahydromethanopterin reductase